MMAGVALRLRKSPLRSSANQKRIDSLVARLKPTNLNPTSFYLTKIRKMYVHVIFIDTEASGRDSINTWTVFRSCL